MLTVDCTRSLKSTGGHTKLISCSSQASLANFQAVVFCRDERADKQCKLFPVATSPYNIPWKVTQKVRQPSSTRVSVGYDARKILWINHKSWFFTLWNKCIPTVQQPVFVDFYPPLRLAIWYHRHKTSKSLRPCKQWAALPFWPECKLYYSVL